MHHLLFLVSVYPDILTSLLFAFAESLNVGQQQAKKYEHYSRQM
jgi:hypothetical protein